MDLLRAANDDIIPATVGFPAEHPGVPTKEHGWFLDTHKRVFARVITPKTKIIVELGSWFGSSAKWFCENTNAIIYAIDIWDDGFILRDEHYVDSNSKLSRLLRDHPLYPTFLANLWSKQDRLVPLRMKTVDGLRFLKARGISPDVIYIDADHHYEPAKEDISTALELFPKAILVGDDYGNYEEVRRAVHECANAAGKTVHVDQNHCWTYISIQSLTGVNIEPKMEEKKKGFKGMMSRYKKLRASAGDEKEAPPPTTSAALSATPAPSISTHISPPSVAIVDTKTTNTALSEKEDKAETRAQTEPLELEKMDDKKRKFSGDDENPA